MVILPTFTNNPLHLLLQRDTGVLKYESPQNHCTWIMVNNSSEWVTMFNLKKKKSFYATPLSSLPKTNAQTTTAVHRAVYFMETQILSIPKHVLHYTRKQIIRWPFQSMAVAETELNAAACRFHSNRRIQSLCAVPCTNLKACSSSAKMELSINLNTVPTGSRGTPKKKKKKTTSKTGGIWQNMTAWGRAAGG